MDDLATDDWHTSLIFIILLALPLTLKPNAEILSMNQAESRITNSVDLYTTHDEFRIERLCMTDARHLRGIKSVEMPKPLGSETPQNMCATNPHSSTPSVAEIVPKETNVQIFKRRVMHCPNP